MIHHLGLLADGVCDPGGLSGRDRAEFLKLVAELRDWLDEVRKAVIEAGGLSIRSMWPIAEAVAGGDGGADGGDNPVVVVDRSSERSGPAVGYCDDPSVSQGGSKDGSEW